MAHSEYQTNVKIGNWYEEKVMEQIRKEQAASSQSRTSAVEQKISTLTEKADVSFCSDGILHVGDTILIQLPNLWLGKAAKEGRCTLSVSPSQYVIQNGLSLDDVPVTGSPDCHRPCVRNIFTIVPKDLSEPLGKPLTYGEPFQLLFTGIDGETYFLTSPSCSLLHTGRDSRRKEVILKADISPHSAWVLQPYLTNSVEESVGKDVQVGALSILIQAMSNQPLVVEEEFTTPTPFGKDHEVSVGMPTRGTPRASKVLGFLAWTKKNLKSNPIDPKEDSIPEDTAEDADTLGDTASQVTADPTVFSDDMNPDN